MVTINVANGIVSAMIDDAHRRAATARAGAIANIAELLGVPITEFYDPHLIRGALEGRGEEAAAVFALVQAYLAIDDAETRHRSIQVVRAMAQASRV